MVGVHIGHNCSVGNNVIIANNVLLGGNVEILDQAFRRRWNDFHQNMRVGRLVMAQGSSAFGKICPHLPWRRNETMVFGLNIDRIAAGQIFRGAKR